MHYNAGDYDLFTYMTNADVFQVREGMIDLLTGPGLGIEINEELVRKEDKEFREGKVEAWRNPNCTSFLPFFIDLM